MGMFDTVNVPCPTCQTVAGFQSKSGDCLLMEYTLEEAPSDVLTDVNRHGPVTCEKCGTRYGVKLTVTTVVVVWTSEDEDDT